MDLVSRKILATIVVCSMLLAGCTSESGEDSPELGEEVVGNEDIDPPVDEILEIGGITGNEDNAEKV